MGLLDGYFDPEQFGEGGGLLGRLLTLQQMQGQYQPGAGFDEARPVAQMPAPQPMSWPTLASYGQPSVQTAASNLPSQYQMLRPALGDPKAMLPTVNPAVGQQPIAQAYRQQSGDIGDVSRAGGGQPIISDASADPVRPGSHYAQAPLGLCLAGPGGCAVGGWLTAGQILGGAALLGGLGTTILNSDTAGRPPAGSRPINQTDWSGDHTGIKKAVGAEASDDVRISPTGEVWVQKPDGSWENHGPADAYTGSGGPSGRRGKDRDR